MWSSYRRKLLDKLQKKYNDEYFGVVLDIGGRDRGAFKKPKENVKKWIFADIEDKHNPDLVLDVANMESINSETIDTISAIELFEHVGKIENGINECYRVLKYSGKIIISVPFLYPIHADPYDFQRWTLKKWETELANRGFEIKKVEIMGLFFTVLSGMYRQLIRKLPPVIKHLLYLSFPILDLFVKLDYTKWAKNHKVISSFHGGYFIIAQKK